MNKLKNELTLRELSEKLDAEFSGDGSLVITHACGLDSPSPGGLAYLTDPKGISSVPVPAGMSRHPDANLEEFDIKQMAFVVPEAAETPPVNRPGHSGDRTDLPADILAGQNRIYAEDPLAVHVRATRLLHAPDGITGGIHPTAVIGEDVELGEGTWAGPHSVLENGVRIGDRTVIHAGVTVMRDVSIGQDCVLYPNAVVQERCEIGNRVIIQSNAVIGSDGHGYYQREGVNLKIPQVGIVRIEDDVEIGACTTIDRARFSVTLIGKGCKIDNQVQIAHNVQLGEQALISAQSAIGGSAQAGDHLILGGQSGIRDNVKVGANVTAVARAVITANCQDNEVLGGMPSRPVSQWRQIQSLVNRLGELFERVRKLEVRVPPTQKEV